MRLRRIADSLDVLVEFPASTGLTMEIRMTQEAREAMESRYARRAFPRRAPRTCSLLDARWKCDDCGGLNMLDEGYCFWCGKEAANVPAQRTPGRTTEED